MRRKPKKKKSLPIIPLIILAVVGVVSVISALQLNRVRSFASRAETSCPGKEDVTGACNPACCSTSDSSTCPQGEECVIQNGYCKSGYSCKPKENKVKRDCTQNICAWISCKPDDDTCCDTDKDPKCIYCDTNEECVGVNITPSPTPAPEPSIPDGQKANKCFELSGDVDVSKDGGGYAFRTHLKVYSPPEGKDGHIQLFVNGNSKGTQWGWNKGVHNPFVIPPEYTEPQTLSSGSRTMDYGVKIDECNQLGNYLNLICRYSVKGGKPSVEGSGCNCTSCDSVPTGKPDNTPAPTSPPGETSAPTKKPTKAPTPTSKPTTKPTVTLSPITPIPPEDETVTIPVEFAYVLGEGVNLQDFVFGQVCFVSAGGGELCQKIDAKKLSQTVTFTIPKKAYANYQELFGRVVNNEGKVFESERSKIDSRYTNYVIILTVGSNWI